MHSKHVVGGRHEHDRECCDWGTSNTSAPFVTSAETEVAILCEAGVVQFELTAEGDVSSEAGLSIETALVSMNVTVESDMNSSTMTASPATGALVLDWEGALEWNACGGDGNVCGGWVWGGEGVQWDGGGDTDVRRLCAAGQQTIRMRQTLP